MILSVFLLTILAILNGLLIAFAFALEYLSRFKVDPSSLIPESLFNRAREVHFACLAGSVAASVGFGWILALAVANLCTLTGLDGWGGILLQVGVFVFCGLFYAVLGFFVPRDIGRQRAEATAGALARLIMAFSMIARPMTIVLHGASRLVLRACGLRPELMDPVHVSEEELLELLNRSQADGELTSQELSLIENVFDFSDTTAKEVMIPRIDVVCLDTTKDTKENLRIARSCGHTRLPLCEGGIDSVIGMIHIKVLFSAMHEYADEVDWRGIARRMLFVTENTQIGKLLVQFQKSRTHMAVVTDEYGGTSGMITLENVLEELVGEIQDEFDKETPEILRVGPAEYLVQGHVLSKEVEEAVGVHLPEVEADSLGGLISATLERIPEKGDQIRLNGTRMIVESVKDRAVHLARIFVDDPVKTSE